MRVFTFWPAGFGKNRKRANESSGRHCTSILSAMEEGLRWSGIPHDPIELMAQTSGLLSYLLSCLFAKRRYDFGELKRSKQTIIVFEVHDDVIVCGQELPADTRWGLFVQFLASLAQEVELKQSIAQHDEYNLVDHHRKGAGGKLSQIDEAFELPVSLFDRGSQMVLLRCLCGVLYLFRVDQEPCFLVAISIGFTAGHHTERHGAGGPAPKLPDARRLPLYDGFL